MRPNVERTYEAKTFHGRGRVMRWRITQVGIVFAIAGCATSRVASRASRVMGQVEQQVASPAEAVDSSLFATIVQSLGPVIQTEGPSRERVIRVNPRPLKPDSTLTWLHSDDFANVGTQYVRQRSEVLAHLSIEQFSVFPDPQCTRGNSGFPGPIENASPKGQSELISPLCVFVALPRPDGAEKTVGSEDDSVVAREPARRWTTRVIVVSAGDYDVFDIVAVRTSKASQWSVVGIQRVFSVTA